MKKILLILMALLFQMQPAAAARLQNHAAIRHAVIDFVRAQTRDLPGKVDIRVSRIDTRLRLNACPRLETFLPAGGHLMGSSAVGVRCPASAKVQGWSLFVPVHVTVTATLLVASHPLMRGTVMSRDDFTGQSGELTQTTLLTDPKQVIGKVLRYSLGAGQPLREDMLRDPYAVTQGQTVTVEVKATNFTVRSEGKALNNAAAGQEVQVRTASGKVVSGKAQASGDVLVRP